MRKILKKYIDDKYPNWDITIALRYLPIVGDLKKSHKDGEKILEVGSEINGITVYLPKKVTGLNIAFDYSKKNELLTPVKGSATKIPFKKESFEYVLSVDMLEHIPKDKRQKAVEEMIRVTKNKLYLSFPCGIESERADKHLHEYFLKKRGEDYQYLRGHVEQGLPDANKIKEVLLSYKDYNLKVYKNTNIHLWKYLLKLGLSGEQFKSSLYRRSLLALPLLKKLNFMTTYRKLFVLERKR